MIYWLGNHFKFIRTIYYKIKSGKYLWGVNQWMYDYVPTGKKVTPPELVEHLKKMFL